MSNHLDSQEIPPPRVLDVCGVDRLLVKLRQVHGADGRPDIAAEIMVARRISTRRKAATAELVPARVRRASVLVQATGRFPARSICARESAR